MKLLYIVATVIFAVNSASALDMIGARDIVCIMGHGCWKESRESGSECSPDENYNGYDGCWYSSSGGGSVGSDGVAYETTDQTCLPGMTGSFAKNLGGKKHDECINDGGDKESCDMDDDTDCYKYNTFRCTSGFPWFYTCYEEHIGGPFYSGTRNKANAQ